MKAFTLMITSLIVIMSFVACNKSGDNNSNVAAPVAPAAQPAANCNNNPANANQIYNPNCSGYSQYTQYGFQAGYNTYYSYSSGYCNCQAGFRPVYGVMGMGCVQVDVFRPFANGAYFYYGNIPNNYQTVNIGQVSNISGYPQTTNCFNNVAYSCFIDQANYCGQGRICRPTAPGSRLGICVNQ